MTSEGKRSDSYYSLSVSVSLVVLSSLLLLLLLLIVLSLVARIIFCTAPMAFRPADILSYDTGVCEKRHSSGNISLQICKSWAGEQFWHWIEGQSFFFTDTGSNGHPPHLTQWRSAGKGARRGVGPASVLSCDSYIYIYIYMLYIYIYIYIFFFLFSHNGYLPHLAESGMMYYDMIAML